MSTSVQNVLAAVNLNFQSKTSSSDANVHSLDLSQKTGSAVSTGSLETCVFRRVDLHCRFLP